MRIVRRFALPAAALLALATAPAFAGRPEPFAAREGLDLAAAAAQAWAPDAFLIYVENDEGLEADGRAPRWGYLFHSPSLAASRAYSVRDGRILVAENLEMKFDAPPLTTQWIDSGAAIAAAENGPVRDYRRKFGGELRTMLLMRGAFQDEHPDEATWTLVYAAPHAPSLFVMVSASDGSVRRTWRG